MIKNKKRLIWVVLGGMILLVVLVPVLVEELNRSDLEVVVFDVGQGDSIFIETSDGFQVLIDGGPNLRVLEKLGQEMSFFDRTVELVVLTHPDHDHLFGLLEVLKRYKVKNILWTGVVKHTAEYEEWVDLVAEEDANVIIAELGQKINLGRPDIYFLVLHPFESLKGKEVKDSNDTSVVVKLVFKDKSFLFTGDISQKIEKQLTNINSDVLKAAHHGSKSSSCAEFIQSVSPEVVVISVGENSYGQPAPEVLQLFEQFGIQVLITKELGDIRFAF
ncbi:hypothetical protein AMJ47_02385 [Parcubacteria bacterium DG_72]|nr:MAG: hypothetical protein AMJ47_02385 [Parcubacteria bacterium DG_72]